MLVSAAKRSSREHDWLIRMSGQLRKENGTTIKGSRRHIDAEKGLISAHNVFFFSCGDL